MTKPAEICYKITVTLLEDLHSGTGTGNLITDAVQARNEDGYPVIDRHHFRGVMKDNALRLERLGVIDASTINSLFGQGGGVQRKLDCSSLTATQTDSLIHWESSARQKNSRCPEDNSMRRIEYIRAGTTLTGSITLFDASGNEQAALENILRFTTRLGSERSRGSGQLTLSWEKQQTKTSTVFDHATINENTTSLRLLLKNTEPLCIPKSGHAGNIIYSESHIPGRTLFAALCSKAHQQGGNEALKALFENGTFKVGNAYPVLPKTAVSDLSQLLSIPMPNHIHAIKQGAAEKTGVAPDLRWPHWAKRSNEPAPQLDDTRDFDFYQNNKQPQDKTSRPKGEIYLIRDANGKWRRYVQPMTIRMRNRRGDPFDKELKRKDTELFSEQRIPENTHFLLDIKGDNGILKTLIGYLKTPLRIGRGKAPVEITACHAQTGNETRVPENTTITLIATSDWIIRGDNLGYLTQLNKTTLGKALGIRIKNTKKSYQESEQQGSFNYASGLPGRPFHVIRRGSSFLLELEEPLQADQLPAAIGERTREGYGQYVIDLKIKLRPHQELVDEQKALEAAEYQERKASFSKQKQEKMELCADYFNACKKRSTTSPPPKEKWDELKQSILTNSDLAYQVVVSTKGAEPDFNFIFRDQKGENLGKTLDNLVKDLAGDEKQQIVKDFIDCYELHLYSEEEQS